MDKYVKLTTTEKLALAYLMVGYLHGTVLQLRAIISNAGLTDGISEDDMAWARKNVNLLHRNGGEDGEGRV